MRVLIANNLGKEAQRLAAAFPTKIGHIYGPGGFKTPRAQFPYALDNGAFPAWARGKPFNESAFLKLCDAAAGAELAPLWVAVPDVVANRDATLANWYAWAPRLKPYGWPLALVVQDGMTPSDIPHDAALVFVGGTTQWKWDTAPMWCASYPRVHIGRVNTERWLWQAHRAGAESVDGSGYFRGRRAQLDGLWYYLADSLELETDAAHGPMQPRLFALGAPAA